MMMLCFWISGRALARDEACHFKELWKIIRIVFLLSSSASIRVPDSATMQTISDGESAASPLHTTRVLFLQEPFL